MMNAKPMTGSGVRGKITIHVIPSKANGNAEKSGQCGVSTKKTTAWRNHPAGHFLIDKNKQYARVTTWPLMSDGWALAVVPPILADHQMGTSNKQRPLLIEQIMVNGGVEVGDTQGVPPSGVCEHRSPDAGSRTRPVDHFGYKPRLAVNLLRPQSDQGLSAVKTATIRVSN